MHDWPAYPNPPATQRVTACARSASGSTITAALPPSSSATLRLPARRRSSQPTAAEPVKVSMRTRGSSTRGAASSTAHGTRLTRTSGVARTRRSSSPSASTVSGSCGGGLSTSVAPHAIAGASLWIESSSGKLNGVMALMGASGKRRLSAQRPSPDGRRSSGSTSPCMRLASSAAISSTKSARSTSSRASVMGLPASRASSSASGARRAARPWRRAWSAAARACEGIAAAAGAAATAASIASTTSARVASGAWPTSEPSQGLRISAVREAGRRVPARRRGGVVMGGM